MPPNKENNFDDLISYLKSREESFTSRKKEKESTAQSTLAASGLSSSQDQVSLKIAESLEQILSQTKDMNSKDASLAMNQLKTLRELSKKVGTDEEREQAKELIRLTESSVKANKEIATKVGETVLNGLNVFATTTAAILSDSPILALAVNSIGSYVSDSFKERKERKDELAEQTKEMREFAEALEDSNSEENPFAEEKAREESVQRQKEHETFEKISDTLEDISEQDNEGSGSNKRGIIAGLSGITTLAAGLGLTIMSVLKTHIFKTLPKILARFNPVVLVIAALSTGLDDALKAFATSGKFSDALAYGLGGIIEFISFGLFDSDTIGSKLAPVFDSIYNLVTLPFVFLQDMLKGDFNFDKTISRVNEGVEGLFAFAKSFTDWLEKIFGISEWWNSVSDSITKIIGEDKIQEMKDSFNMVRESINSVVEFIMSIPQIMFDQLTSIKDGIYDLLPDSLKDIFSEDEDIKEINPMKKAKVIELKSVREQRDNKTESSSEPSSINTVISSPVNSNTVQTRNVFNNMSASPKRRIRLD